MSVLDDKHILADAGLESCPCDVLEEGSELAKLTHLCEFVLEVGPDVVGLSVLSLLLSQQDLVSDFLIEVLVESSELGALDISFSHILVVWINFENSLSHVEVDTVIISQFQV